MSNLVYYRPDCDSHAPVRLHRNDRGMLVLEMDGVSYERIQIAYGLPRALPQGYIAVQNQLGKQIALIHCLSLLDEASRAEATRELERAALLPVIERIDSIAYEQGDWVWQVQTSCGAETIVMRATSEQLHRLSQRRWILVNYNDHRCELRDLTALDDVSRLQAEDWLERFG
ncbi:DUF1854 domain-containing protein [Paenibacillus daejeonensis]|uniref:DUF1854 domain-containing protein n=1 Tax=Paenibacillus daejeonensis TaxID=135193 RepID=UPI00036C63A9|nr:DUF1854 domain-containing protein [Paenibacillus daejeonensis]